MLKPVEEKLDKFLKDETRQRYGEEMKNSMVEISPTVLAVTEM